MNVSAALRQLHRMDHGSVSVRAAGYHDTVEFHSGDGWVVRGFYDDGVWDYLDSIVSPDGQGLSYEQLQGTELEGWIPSTGRFDHARERWRIGRL